MIGEIYLRGHVLLEGLVPFVLQLIVILLQLRKKLVTTSSGFQHSINVSNPSSNRAQFDECGFSH